MTTRIEGRCHCGAVSVSVPEDAFGVVACHCDDCQKLHGNFFAMVVTDRDHVQWTGEESIQWYASSAKAKRGFCVKCGSRLAKAPEGSTKIMVSMGLFPRELPRRIKKNVYGESKPAWYDLPAES